MLAKISWFVLAAIHLTPALALPMPSILTRLYGIEGGDPAFALLWHRAALFAVVLLLCIWAALRVEVRPLAVVAVALSMISFLAIYALTGTPAALRTVALADLVGLPFLAIVAWGAFRAPAAG